MTKRVLQALSLSMLLVLPQAYAMHTRDADDSSPVHRLLTSINDHATERERTFPEYRKTAQHLEGLAKGAAEEELTTSAVQIGEMLTNQAARIIDAAQTLLEQAREAQTHLKSYLEQCDTALKQTGGGSRRQGSSQMAVLVHKAGDYHKKMQARGQEFERIASKLTNPGQRGQLKSAVKFVTIKLHNEAQSGPKELGGLVAAARALKDALVSLTNQCDAAIAQAGRLSDQDGSELAQGAAMGGEAELSAGS